MMYSKTSAKYLIYIIKFLIYTSLPHCKTHDIEGNVVANESTANNTSHVYTFALSNSFMRLETNESWDMNKPREVIFEFRYVS